MKFPQGFPEIPNLPRLLKLRSMKSYFPVFCSNLMNHPLYNLPWRTFWCSMYFSPPRRPTQPASGKDPSIYLSKLGCKYLVMLLRYKLCWTLLEEKPLRGVRSTARASFMLLLGEAIAREQFELDLAATWAGEPSGTSTDLPLKQCSIFPLTTTDWLNEPQATVGLCCCCYFLHYCFFG